MITREQAAEIRRLYFGERWKIGTIADQLGVHHQTVSRAVGELNRAATAAPRVSVLEPYKPFIHETLQCYPRLRSTRLFDMLCERGYSGSARTLRHYVTQVRPTPRKEVFLRTETLPGEQAQVDWAHVGTIAVPGGQRPLWAFVMVLSYSRALWAELVLDLTVHSLCQSLVRAGAYFGGFTRQWLFDNPKIVVLERHGDVVRFQPTLLELCSAVHVQPRLCGVRKPQQKGRVERAIRYLKESFFAARKIHSVDEGNSQLLAFAQGKAMRRQHPTRPDRTVDEVLQEERARLLQLPETLPSTNRVVPARVDKTATIRFDNNRYSVPPEHAHTFLTLVTNDRLVRLIHMDKEVARHQRCWGRGLLIEAPEHRQALLEIKRGAQAAKGKDRLCAELERAKELLQHWTDEGRNMGSMTSRLLKMLDVYGKSTLNEAIFELLDRGGHDLGSLTVLCEKRRVKKPVALPLTFAAHVQDRDVIPHDIGGYDV
jgi:transposase